MGGKDRVRIFTECIERDDQLGEGGFGDVYRGIWRERPQDISYVDIVIKVIRCADAYDARVLGKRVEVFSRELAVLQSLDHNNIVPFIGMAYIGHLRPAIVSEWMPNGTVKNYLSKNSGVSIEPLALGIAKGLRYLHCHNPATIHGNLKADNVLVDQNGCPRLCDFGLGHIFGDDHTGLAVSLSWHWEAPERLSGGLRTKPSDIYAFGMTCIELYTGEVPFYPLDQYATMTAVLAGARPQRPPDSDSLVRPRIPDPMWQLMHCCWKKMPSERPSVTTVVEVLQGLQPNTPQEIPGPLSPGFGKPTSDVVDLYHPLLNSRRIWRIPGSSRKSAAVGSEPNTKHFSVETLSSHCLEEGRCQIHHQASSLPNTVTQQIFECATILNVCFNDDALKRFRYDSFATTEIILAFEILPDESESESAIIEAFPAGTFVLEPMSSAETRSMLCLEDRALKFTATYPSISSISISPSRLSSKRLQMTYVITGGAPIPPKLPIYMTTSQLRIGVESDIHYRVTCSVTMTRTRSWLREKAARHTYEGCYSIHRDTNRDLAKQVHDSESRTDKWKLASSVGWIPWLPFVKIAEILGRPESLSTLAVSSTENREIDSPEDN